MSDTQDFSFDDPVTTFGVPYLKKVNFVLHCGDLMQVGGIGEYKRTLEMLGSVDAKLNEEGCFQDRRNMLDIEYVYGTVKSMLDGQKQDVESFIFGYFPFKNNLHIEYSYEGKVVTSPPSQLILLTNKMAGSPRSDFR